MHEWGELTKRIPFCNYFPPAVYSSLYHDMSIEANMTEFYFRYGIHRAEYLSFEIFMQLKRHSFFGSLDAKMRVILLLGYSKKRRCSLCVYHHIHIYPLLLPSTVNFSALFASTNHNVIAFRCLSNKQALERIFYFWCVWKWNFPIVPLNFQPYKAENIIIIITRLLILNYSPDYKDWKFPLAKAFSFSYSNK